MSSCSNQLVFLESCPILRKRKIGPGFFSIWLDTTKIAKSALPGQFVSIRFPSFYDPYLRRPFACADAEENRLRIVFRVQGRLTSLLSERHEGDFLSVLGPLGRPILGSDSALFPSLEEKEIFVIGGGTGVAPLLFLVKKLILKNQVWVFLGAKGEADLVMRNEFLCLLPERTSLATESGEIGEKGKVTEVLFKSPIPERAFLFASGPRPMYQELKKRLKNRIYAFFEERMGCGSGLCLSCVVGKKGGGYFHICQDGPVLDLEAVVL